LHMATTSGTEGSRAGRCAAIKPQSGEESAVTKGEMEDGWKFLVYIFACLYRKWRTLAKMKLRNETPHKIKLCQARTST